MSSQGTRPARGTPFDEVVYTAVGEFAGSISGEAALDPRQILHRGRVLAPLSFPSRTVP
jgi:hypothetical protein